MYKEIAHFLVMDAIMDGKEVYCTDKSTNENMKLSGLVLRCVVKVLKAAANDTTNRYYFYYFDGGEENA